MVDKGLSLTFRLPEITCTCYDIVFSKKRLYSVSGGENFVQRASQPAMKQPPFGNNTRLPSSLINFIILDYRCQSDNYFSPKALVETSSTLSGMRDPLVSRNPCYVERRIYKHTTLLRWKPGLESLKHNTLKPPQKSQSYSHAYVNTRETGKHGNRPNALLNGRWLERTETTLMHFKWGSVWIVTLKKKICFRKRIVQEFCSKILWLCTEEHFGAWKPINKQFLKQFLVSVFREKRKKKRNGKSD